MKGMSKMKKKFAKRVLSTVSSAAVFISGFLPALNGKVTGAEDYASDGLPILQSYENSMWYKGNELGVAGDFGFFAFDFLDGCQGSHQNMNFAAPHVVNIAPMYFQSYFSDAGRYANVASVSLENGSGEYYWKANNDTDLLVTPEYQFLTADGENIDYGTTAANGSNDVKLYFGSYLDNDGKINLTKENSSRPAYYGHVSETFIDFAALRDEYFATSQNYVNAVGDKTFTIEDLQTGTVELASVGNNIINITPEHLEKG